MSADDFFAVLEKTPSVDLEIELLSRAILKTRGLVAVLEAGAQTQKDKLTNQKYEMIRLLAKAESLVPGRISSVFDRTIGTQEVAP